MNIQEEEEGCELDKSGRPRREKRGRGRQKIQTSRRLMRGRATPNGQQGKWDTFTWLFCAVWTSSLFIRLFSCTWAGSTDPLASTCVKSADPGPSTHFLHPWGASLSVGRETYRQITSTLRLFILFQHCHQKNVSSKSPSPKSLRVLVLSPVKCKAKAVQPLCLQLPQETSIGTLRHHS